MLIPTSNTWRRSWWGQVLQNSFITLVLAMIVAVPLLASPADAHLTGIAALTFETFALLLGVTLLWRSHWNVGREQITTFLRTGANLPVLLFMGLVLISCALAPHKLFAVQETLRIGAGVLLYFVVAYQFRQSKHLLMLVDTLIFLAIAVSFLTMAQYTLADTSLAGERGTILFGNQQPLGSLLMILLPVVVVMAVTEKQLSKRQIAAQVASVMTAGGLLLAHTRSAWIGATVGLLVLAILVLSITKIDKARKKRSMSRKTSGAATPGVKRDAAGPGRAQATTGRASFAAQKHNWVLPVFLTLLTTAFIVSLSIQNTGIFNRVSTLFHASTDASLRARQQDYWAGAVKMIAARPWTGWGIGQYPIHQYEFTGQGRRTEDIATLQARVNLAEQAHNLYLQRGAELGLPGLALLVIVIVTFLFQAVSRVGHMDPGVRRSLLMASIGATVAFAIDAISNPSWQFAQLSLFLWLMLGAGVACLRPQGKREDKSGDQSGGNGTSQTASPGAASPGGASPRTALPLTRASLLRRALSVGAALFMFGMLVLPSASRVAPDVSRQTAGPTAGSSTTSSSISGNTTSSSSRATDPFAGRGLYYFLPPLTGLLLVGLVCYRRRGSRGQEISSQEFSSGNEVAAGLAQATRSPLKNTPLKDTPLRHAQDDSISSNQASPVRQPVQSQPVQPRERIQQERIQPARQQSSQGELQQPVQQARQRVRQELERRQLSDRRKERRSGPDRRQGLDRRSGLTDRRALLNA